MRKLVSSVLVITLLTIAFGIPVTADVPHLISFQGRATDASGVPLQGSQTLTFAIYDSQTGGTRLWSSGAREINVTDGLFPYLLGSNVALPADLFVDNSPRWLGITVESDPELTPRTQLVAVPYAYHAKSSDTAQYALGSPGGSGAWIDDGTTVRLADGRDSVGIGVSDPSVKLEVEGDVTAVYGHTDGTGLAAGVMGFNGSTGYGVMGMSSEGRGVFGTTATGFGGYFFGPKHYFSPRVGIGTDNPQYALHVMGDDPAINTYVRIQAGYDGGTWGRAGVSFTNGTDAWRWFVPSTADSHMPASSIGLYSQYGAAQVLTATQSGRLGVMSTNPTRTLTVNGSIGLQTSETDRWHFGYYNGGLNISETSVADYRLFLQNGGNVGIGTGSPSARLHVNGGAYINGDADVAGTFHADAFEANAIGRDNIIDEVGIAVAPTSSTTQTIADTWTTYHSREITVPTAGYIVALADASIEIDHGLSGYCSVYIGIADSPDSQPDHVNTLYLGNDFNEGTIRTTLATKKLFYCPSAGTYTYYLQGIHYGDDAPQISNKTVFLLFIPTVYSSKNGVAEAIGDDILYPTPLPMSAEIEAATNATRTAASPDATSNNDELVDLVRSLSAELKDMKSRLEEVEKR
ncbi:MAG: hypothetical protein KKA42_08160 [candidate division Zixibacteria bacterium]|nr:hypothetical protein [candidate division Zixibacteria bacterium]